jgi:hypothetical protein
VRRAAISLIALAALSACQLQRTGSPSEPWALEEVRPNTSDGIRILVLHDMEGLSGQSDPRTFFFGTPQYPRGQESVS